MANKDDVVTTIKNRTRVIIKAAAPLGLKDDILEADLDIIIDAALRDFSTDEPRTILEDHVEADLLDVDGVKFFNLSPTWDEDVSDEAEIKIEFPVDLPRTRFLRRGHDLAWTFVERPVAGVRNFFIKFFEPPSGVPPADTWRLRYKTRWLDLTEDPDLSELKPKGVFLLGLLAGVYTARSLAAKFAKTVEAQIGADVVDYRSKQNEFTAIANELWTEYQDRLDRPSKIKRAGQDADIVDLDLTVGRNNRFGARQYLVHRTRRR